MYCLAFFGFTLKVFVVFQYKNTLNQLWIFEVSDLKIIFQNSQ